MRCCSSLRFFLALRPRLVLLAEHCQLDVNLREYSENVGLQDRDEDLEREEHDRGCHGDHSHKRPEVQDEAEEDEDDQVPRQNVGVESHPERQRLGELLHDLDERHERDHDRLGRQTRRHQTLDVRPQPVAPHALELGQKKGQEREGERKRDAARHGVAVREEPDDIKHQQKDEERERVGEPLPALLGDLTAEVVAAEAVELLHDDLVHAGPVLEVPGTHEHDEERYRSPYKQEPDTLIDRDVYRPQVQRDDPFVLGALPGVEDLVSYLLLAQLLYERQASHQLPTLRPAHSRAEPGAPGFALGSFLVLATLTAAATFSAIYTPANPVSMGTTGHNPRYAGIPSTAVAKTNRATNDPAPIITPAAIDRPANSEMVSAVERKLKTAVPAP